MLKNSKLFKRIVSGMSAAVMMATNALPFVPASILASAEDTPAAAHTINVFDINLKSGADCYSTYTPDDPSGTGVTTLNGDGNGVYVWQADNSNSGHKFVYNIKLSISGEGNSDNGEMTDTEFIKIRIPEHILKFSSSSSASGDTDTVEMPVPKIDQIEYKEVNGVKVYATDHQFVYDYDAANKEYIIYNIAPVSAGVVYEFPVAYVMDKNTWEYQDLGASEPFKAKVEIKSWNKRNNITEPIVRQTLDQETREIPVYVDTDAKITKTVKKADAVLIDADEAKTKLGLSENLDSNYKYVVWSVTSDISDVTQKYSLKLDDITSNITGDNDVNIAGEIAAVKMGSTFFTSNFDNCVLNGLTASGKRTDYVLTRYNKAEVDSLENKSKPAVYTASNDVTVKLTPADGQDKYSEQPGTAAFKYEIKDPEWFPLDVGFTSNKWGLYNNGRNHVSNKTNISSYSMNDLTTDGKTVSGLQYETKSTAHAYGKTITDLNNEITALNTTDNHDGTVTIAAGDRIYVFNTSDAAAYTLNGISRSISGSYTAPLSTLNMQRIVAQDIADSYYGQKALDYIFDDKTFSLSDVNDSSVVKPLGKDDYKIDRVNYEYLVRQYVYDAANMEFSAGEDNEYISDESQNILDFYVYNDGSDTPVPVGSYNILTGTSSITAPALVSSLTAENITFADDANITGYQIKTSNKYFYVELITKPSITLKASEIVKPIVEDIVNNPTTKEQKIAINNTCNWTVKNGSTELLNTNRTGTDYIADIIRTSSISKKALGEKTYITGQDGKTYRSRNDTLAGQYELAWQSKIAETADGVEVNGRLENNVPVAQQSGIFYDLLPSHSDIIEGSVNVYVDASKDVDANTTALPPSSFEVLDRIDDYNGSGKKLLVIKINAPCNSSYTVTYVTVHSHEDIQDYGSFALNTVAYQTGNADIGDGYPDDGGNYAVSMSAYIKGLDPDNGTAKRFIYAEATEDILALFPTSSGIYKKVSTQNDPTYRKTGVVHNGETYTYSIRMQNDSSTKATDIAILDSVENYRTVKGESQAINSGLSYDRDWNGRIVSFDLQGIEDKMGEDYKDDLKLILYTGSDPVNLDNQNYSEVGNRKYILYKILGLENTEKGRATAAELTPEKIAAADAAAENWKVVDWRNPSGLTKPSSTATIDEIEAYNADVKSYMEKVTAFIVYTGEAFTLPKGDSLSFTLKMQAPDSVRVDKEPDVANGVFLTPPKTYNNIYRSFTSQLETSAIRTYFYTHYDYTQVEYSTVGTVKFSKRDSETDETIPGVTFNLSGISDYGTAYNETLISDGNGVVTFKDLERGTYQLIESISDDDHQLDPAPKTVMVDPQGVFTFVKVDGEPLLKLDQNGKVIPDNYDNVFIDENGNFSVKNDPRYHGDLSFRKVDSLSGKGISGTKFTLEGTSIYNTVYDPDIMVAQSDANGNVVFENIEKGTYTLKEITVSDGYLPPKVNEYQVTSSGTRDLVFKITGENAVNAGTEYQIKNIPTAEMTLQKVDAITKDTLDDAVFTLTADASLNSTISSAVNRLPAGKTPWIESGGKWVQTVSGSISSGTGRYVFSYLPEGTYTLAETTSPTHYKANPEVYTIKVVKSTDGKKLVIELPSGKSEWEYIKLENGEFVPATADTAAYQRLNNTEVYEDGKTVVKSWIGGVDNNFPSLHLSTEKPEAEVIKVTIRSASGVGLRKLVADKKSNIKSFERSASLPTGVTVDRTTNTNSAYTDSTYTDETGNFYAWYDETDQKIKWWSDADIIYMPPDCSFLFLELNTVDSEINLSDLDFSKVANMQGMFASTTDISGKGSSRTKIKTITFPSNIDTSKVTNMDGVFWGCSQLTTLDLTGFNTANVSSMRAMFKNCSKLEEIKLDPTKFTDDNLTTVYRMFDECNALKQIDFRGFKGGKLENAQSWFAQCKNLEYIDLSNFDSGSNITNLNWTFQNLGSENSNGCAIFSNKWNLNNVPNHTDTIKGANFNLYGTSYSPAGYADSCFDIATAAETSGTTSLYNDGKANRYFNDPNSSYYTTFFDEAYRNKIITVTQPTTSPTAITFGNYTNFEKYGSVTQVKNTTATADDVGKTSFTFEYVTANTAVPSGVTEYEVGETIYMTVSKIVEDSGTYYTVSQKYKYDGTAKAKWTEVGGTAPTQWKCEMQVFDADDEFFAWEDTVTGYTSTADENNPIKTVGRNDKPVITNSTPDVKVGDLELSKLLTGGKQKYSGDTFTFKVTMWTDSAKTTKYTMLPFDSNGEALFDVIPNAEDDDKVIIKGIPANYVYEVEEVGINGGSSGLNGEYTASAMTGTSGAIAANDTKKAEITNTINTADLSLTKNAVLKKNTAEAPDTYTEVTDTSDTDYSEWENEDFTFTVTFENLAAGQAYSYTIDNDPQYVVVNGNPVEDKIIGNDKSSETVKTITIKGGQVVVFKNIPVGTKYTIVETSSFDDTEAITYTTENDKNTADGKSTEEQTLSAADSVTFTNTKQINETLIPEYVEVTVNKKWYSEDSLDVHWMTNSAGKAVKFRLDEATNTYVEDDDKGAYIPMDSNNQVLTNYPSFLKVYLGRALAVPREEEGTTVYTYLDVTPGYSSDSLNVKGGWSSTFTDLEKYGEVVEYDTATSSYVTRKYQYVYFVSEVVPIGFSNVTGITTDLIPDEPKDVKTKIGTDEFFVATGDNNKLDFTLKNKEDETCSLSICKLVTGNFGNKAKDYKFEIEFTKSDGTALVGTGFTMQFTDVYDSTYVRNRTYTLENGKLKVDLPHGKKVSFLSLPKGTSYKITETNGDGYNTHSGTYKKEIVGETVTGTDDPLEVDVSTLTGGKSQSGTLAENTNYLFVNDMTGDVPTGISLAVTSITIVFIIISGCIVYLMIKRRKERMRSATY